MGGGRGARNEGSLAGRDGVVVDGEGLVVGRVGEVGRSGLVLPGQHRLPLLAVPEDRIRHSAAGPVRVGIEAAVRAGGWDRWLLGERGREAKAGFIGMSSFGASAPAGELYKHFGITAEATVAKVKELLG